jgi:acyl-CoA synthetase (NDP forming)
MKMAYLSSSTVEKIGALLEQKRLDSLVEVKNPLDINPSADDETHILAVKYLAQDPGVDAVVVGLDPLSPAMRTLAECGTGRYDFQDPLSIAVSFPQLTHALNKPVVGVVDGGRLYDPLVDELIKKTVVVFRSSDRAIRALALYIQGRLNAERVRQMWN